MMKKRVAALIGSASRRVQKALRLGAPQREGRSTAPVLAALLTVLLSGSAWAEARSYTVYRAQTPPKIDGRLDDECWRAAPWQTGFTLLGGGAIEPQLQTQFAMVWDDQNLYVAVRCQEPATDHLAAKADDGSNDVFRDDHIEIFFAPEKQRDNYIQLAVNSLNRRLDLSYEAKKVVATLSLANATEKRWVSACRVVRPAWEVEMALPLAALKIEAKAGFEFAGNVARARRADTPEQPGNSSWTPLVNGFDRDPDAFGAFRLGGAPTPMMRALSLAVEQRHDVVTTLMNDRLTGALTGIGADGWAHINGPQYGGEVALAVTAIDHIEIPTAKRDRTGPKVMLTTGDYVQGEIKSITPEQTVIAGGEVGTLTIPSSVVSEIHLAGGAQTFIDTSFDSDDMSPWLPVSGLWAVRNGRAVYSGGEEGEGVLSAPLPQKSAVTMVVDLEAMRHSQFQCELVLFSGQTSRQAMRSGVCLNFWGAGGQIQVVTPENDFMHVGQLELQQMMNKTSVRVRFAYDPKDNSIKLWVAEQPAGQFKAPGGPKEGRYVLLVARSPMGVKHVRVMPEIVPPTEENAVGAGLTRVILSNNDTITAKEVTFADGKFQVKTEFGLIQVEANRVSDIHFAREAPAASAEPGKTGTDIRIQTTEGIFTLRSLVLTEEALMGESDTFGAITLKRDTVRSIHFRRGGR